MWSNKPFFCLVQVLILGSAGITHRRERVPTGIKQQFEPTDFGKIHQCSALSEEPHRDVAGTAISVLLDTHAQTQPAPHVTATEHFIRQHRHHSCSGRGGPGTSMWSNKPFFCLVQVLILGSAGITHRRERVPTGIKQQFEPTDFGKIHQCSALSEEPHRDVAGTAISVLLDTHAQTQPAPHVTATEHFIRQHRHHSCSGRGGPGTTALTNKFLERLGCSPRFSTPDHPESNGSVERWNRVFKNMLFHVIRQDGRNWDKFIPFLLWAYREVPHDTTGVSPFRMLYGRDPVGPLAILKTSWTGERQIPSKLADAPAEYLRELKTQLELAADSPGLRTSRQQAAYASHYNKHTAVKSFREGDTVLVFDDNQPGKIKPGRTGKKRTTSTSKLVSAPPSLRLHVEPYFSMFSDPTAAASPRNSPPPPPTTDGEQPTDQVTYLLKQFDVLYRPYKNVIQASAVFNTMKEKENQTFDEFVTDLRRQAEKCDIGEKKDRLIGDPIVVRIRDAALRERLFRERDLTLDKIITTCKAAEISKKHVKELQEPNFEVQALQKPKQWNSQKPATMENRQQKPQMTLQQKFSRCWNNAQTTRMPCLRFQLLQLWQIRAFCQPV
ncbi:hypothetical protein MTO96_005728 [Rhipicephalus appendiculatus]